MLLIIIANTSGSKIQCGECKCIEIRQNFILDCENLGMSAMPDIDDLIRRHISHAYFGGNRIQTLDVNELSKWYSLEFIDLSNNPELVCTELNKIPPNVEVKVECQQGPLGKYMMKYFFPYILHNLLDINDIILGVCIYLYQVTIVDVLAVFSLSCYLHPHVNIGIIFHLPPWHLSTLIVPDTGNFILSLLTITFFYFLKALSHRRLHHRHRCLTNLLPPPDHTQQTSYHRPLQTLLGKYTSPRQCPMTSLPILNLETTVL